MFAQTLDAVLTELGLSNVTVAGKLVSPGRDKPITQPHISRLRSGRVRPSDHLVDQLIAVVGPAHGERLREAWLRDNTPPRVRSQVAELAARTRQAEERVRQLEGLVRSSADSPELPEPVRRALGRIEAVLRDLGPGDWLEDAVGLVEHAARRERERRERTKGA